MKAPEPSIVGRQLVIVHNVDSGLVTGARTAWQRLRQPQAAPCALCALTRGVRGTNPRWQAYLDSRPETVQTLTRDQFHAEHPASHWRTIVLPVILLQTDGHLEKLVSASAIRKATSVKQLIERLDQSLQKHPSLSDPPAGPATNPR